MACIDDNRNIVKKPRLNLINLKYCLELRYRPAAAVIGELPSCASSYVARANARLATG